ncbi:zinc finger C-x8-C-x5-C-x3-H type family protein [Actinidia rufa]|uniref:Zinc finger C-x8-C-x5-C-x3-H type family protein n=1 Tax=Actinidia rufa TaxID=165716 RepID=A0A7J0EFT3_9ERIC|nr:zinc finger C-x8-C-x5-C-x3-H type family protein [Actinidia rufa]
MLHYFWIGIDVDFTNAEPTRQLGLGSGTESYPERPDDPDCIYYLRTGFCGYGARCRFNHPRDRSLGNFLSEWVNLCASVNLGVTCKFHHPQPAGIQVSAPLAGPLPASAIYPSMHSPSAPSSQQYGAVAGNWPVARPALIPGSYLQGAYSPVLLPPGMVPLSGWNPFQTPVSTVASPSTQSTGGAAPIYGLTQLSPSAPVYTGAYFPLPDSAGPSSSSQKEHAFPERPGQPECQYYMKTGDCKFGSSCRYHHPPEWSAPKMNFALNLMNLPLRPVSILMKTACDTWILMTFNSYSVTRSIDLI